MLDKRNIFLQEKYQQAEPFLNKLPLNETFLNVINPHADHPTSVLALAKSLWRNRQLIVQMTKREVIVRYQGSVFGLAWSFSSVEQHKYYCAKNLRRITPEND